MIKNSKLFLITMFSLTALICYLFITAPPPLAAKNQLGRTVSIEFAFEMLQYKNAVTREIYTRDIVGRGAKRGIKFDENWQEEDVFALPLPAQFLRETARSLERSRVQLGLYLASDYSINEANNVEGEQLELLKQVRESRDAQFLYINDAQRYAYMFPDFAVVKPCVKCHNDHDESPKNDWRLNDVMGATTWTYPENTISIDTFFKLLATLDRAIETAYTLVLNEAEKLPNPPRMGEQWPESHYAIPNKETFIAAIHKRASPEILARIVQHLHPHKI